MNKTGSNLLFLAVGAALGAAVGFIAASDRTKKKEWVDGINSLAHRVKKATCRKNGHIDDLTSDIDGE